jgi:hypothetical protein
LHLNKFWTQSVAWYDKAIYHNKSIEHQIQISRAITLTQLINEVDKIYISDKYIQSRTFQECYTQHTEESFQSCVTLIYPHQPKRGIENRKCEVSTKVCNEKSRDTMDMLWPSKDDENDMWNGNYRKE